MKQRIKAVAFREDLYFRLHVVSLELPPLRDRLEDFIPLAEYFLERYSTHILETAMRRSNWSQTKAAELLGLQRTYLAPLLKQKGIQQGAD